MEKPLVGVILANRADFNVMRRGLETLRVMGVPYVFEMASPTKTLDRLVRFVSAAPEAGIEVLIAATGGNGLLPSLIACHTNLPVIGVPVDTTTMRGEDALLGITQMPPGAPVACVGINASENAAILATQILALKHARFRSVLAHRRQALGQRLDSAYNELVKEYPDLCDRAQTAPSLRSGVAESDTDPGLKSEEATPEPPADRSERIRPGAMLPSMLVPAPTATAQRLVSTPMPHEPGTVTEDGSLMEPGAASPPPVPPSPQNRLPIPPALQLASVAPLTPSLLPASLFSLNSQPQSPTRATPSEPVRKLELSSEAEPTPSPSALSKRTPTPPQPAPRSVDTRVFRVDHKAPDENILEHAMLVLLEGGIVALPTDTVYGLAADATNVEAVRRLFGLKGADPGRKSLSMLIGDTSALDTLVREVPGALERVLDTFWPGGLTVLFSRRLSVLPEITDSPSIGVRIPGDPVALQLLGMMGRPLVVINAAVGGSAPATAAEGVQDKFAGQIECLLDAGPCRASEPSTVLSALIEPFEILREGAVKRESLKRVLGDKLKA